MPMAISTLATTRSMIRNGMKMVKPIWNAVFSSLVTKAGTSTENGTSSGPFISGVLAIWANIARSFSRVWRSMNWRIGTAAREAAVSRLILFSESGL
ncbi:hypothetical protein D3C87_1452140 [compost metagenome]